MVDDLTIDDLLLATAHIGKGKPIRSRTERFTDSMELPCTIHCKCGTTYDVIAMRPKKWYDHYKRLDYYPQMCPKCCTFEMWLEHFYTAKPIKNQPV